ncbi:MAG: hypothetical protein HDR08_07755 [Lachnospiraceae bacterium]|nr:hypothetical protein [Lachnospiraceae bacterium]
MKNMLIIKDLRDWFWVTYPDWTTKMSLNVEYITKYFEDLGYCVELTSYREFDYAKNYAGYIVLYTSAEDYCGGSKAFIEDVLVYLKQQGAVLLPEFRYFRAHDNKVMMEILRSGFEDDRLKTIHSSVWPSYEALKAAHFTEYPVIIKKAGGAGGEGVFLAKNQKELYRYAEKVSRMTNLLQFYYLSCVNVKQKLLGKKPVLIHNSKFITQNYIAGLSGDYKVLVFGEHYFVLHRLNRTGDFRASGSGQFTQDAANEIEAVLEFAENCKASIHAPWLSLDICHDGSACHLIEFQCISFGFKAMSLSERHYMREGGKWKVVEGRVMPEQEFCDSVRYYLEKYREE